MGLALEVIPRILNGHCALLNVLPAALSGPSVPTGQRGGCYALRARGE
jgi:hypothetical protein